MSTLSKRISWILYRYFVGPDHPMKIRLWTTLFRWMNYPRIVVPYETGLISIDYRDHYQAKLFDSLYEPEVWDTLARIAVHDEVFWDVGANIGMVTLRALRHPALKAIHSFEAHPQIASILEENVSLNRGAAVVHQYALGDESGRFRLFNGPPANVGVTRFDEDYGFGATDVECHTIDEVIRSGKVPAPTLLKIDVEGWEERVLRGARELIKNHPPKAIVLEAEARADGSLKATGLRELLPGYSIQRIPRSPDVVEARENYLARLSPTNLV